MSGTIIGDDAGDDEADSIARTSIALEEPRWRRVLARTALSGAERKRRSTAREIEASRREDCGGKIPNASSKSMRGR
jgi:hypothetical protein